MPTPGGSDVDLQKLGYEIVEPISFDVFSIDGQTSSDTGRTNLPVTPVKIERLQRYAEDWDDAEKEGPQWTMTRGNFDLPSAPSSPS
jgi:hypothetical protein